MGNTDGNSMSNGAQTPRPLESSGQAFPPDLSAWLEKAALIRLVQEIVSQTDGSRLQLMIEAETGIRYPAEEMLVLLSYCYTVGIYASETIAKVVHQDAQLQLVWGDRCPHEDTIAWFRRHHHSAVHRCLEQLFGRIWQMKFGQGTKGLSDAALPPPSADTEWIDPVLQQRISGEVEDRILFAVELDSTSQDW